MESFCFIVKGILLNMFVVFGLIGNALTIFVMSKTMNRTSINCLLIGLGVADSILLFCIGLICGIPEVTMYSGWDYYYYHVFPYLVPFVTCFGAAAQAMSVYLMVFVTVERWLAVCHPFRAARFCTMSNARWCVIGTLIFSMASNIPRYFDVSVVEEQSNDGQNYTTIQNERSHAYDVVFWLYLLILYIVPASVLAVLNTCILRQVRRAWAERARMSQVQRRDIGLCVILLMTILIFFLSSLLPIILFGMVIFEYDKWIPYEWLSNLYCVSTFSQAIHYALNCVIYVIFSDKFKRGFIKIFCRKKPQWKSMFTIRKTIPQEIFDADKPSPENYTAEPLL